MYRHGIYVSEQETSMIAPLNGTAGLQVVIGTAPVHLLADPAAAINKPLLVYSKAEAIAAVGYSDDFASFTRDKKSRTFSSNSKRSHILRTSSRSIRLILSSIVSFAVSLKWTRTI